MTIKFVRIGFIVAVFAVGVVLQAQAPSSDWPQWRGPKRDATVAVFSEPRSWPPQLTQKWKAEVGLGYATPILVGNRIFMFTRRGDNEVIAAVDATTGKELWQTGYPAPFVMNSAAARHGQGPKSTPAFANGKLFTLGMGGIVTAFDAATGKQLWQKPGSAPGPLFATAMSPLVDGDSVIVHVGSHNQGALTAFDVNNGNVKWSWNGDGPGYGSPIAVEIGGLRQIITFTQENLVGVSAARGELLWKRPFTTRSTQNTITPIVYGDTLIISGLDNPVSAIRIARRDGQWSAETVWENPAVPMYMTNGVIVGDMLLGMTHRNSGQLFLLDAKSGKTLWTGTPRLATNAAILRAGDLAFVLKDDGELLVGRADANGFQVLHQYTVANSSTWAVPVVSGNRIFVKDESGLTLWTVG
jgi:outer membrane protein assembly factor BamB